MEQSGRIHFNSLVDRQQRFLLAFRAWGGDFLRRLMDFMGAALGLVLLSPLFAFIAVLLKLDTPGPVFYRGSRVGKGGKLFGMVKFRTMYEDPDSYQGPRVTGEGDPRITPMGQWLRDTKLNELPQLWNVLLGDMSLFGPRPEDPEYVAHWPEETRKILLSVRPGITSPASVVYRDEEKMIQAAGVEDVYLNEILPTKLRLDCLYLKRRSIVSDLDVLLWTLVMLIPLISKRKIPDHLLYWGPISRLVTRYFNWFVVDMLVTFLIVAGLGGLWRYFTPLNIGLNTAVIAAVIMVFLFSTFNVGLGLSRMLWSKAKADYALLLFVSAALATGLLLLLNQLLPVRLPATLVIVSGLLAWMGFVIVRYRLRLVSGAARHWLSMRPSAALLGERVLIIGAGVVGRFAAVMLNEEDLLPAYAIVGMVDDDPQKNGMQIGDCRVLGTTEKIPEVVEKFDVNIIVFGITELAEGDRERILRLCRQTNARLVFLPDIVHSIKSRFVPSFENQPAPSFMAKHFNDELQELNKLLEQGLVNEAQNKIRALQGRVTSS
jgi:lipopolysaccharide/colanic/teichoic acid biosynthesis glycosyltransferase